MIRVLSFTVVLVPGWALVAGQGAEDARSSTSERPGGDRDIRPLLAKYCFSCHGEKKSKAGLNLEALRDERDSKAWKLVWDRIKSRQMPPSGTAQPTAEERKRVTAWIEG